LHLISLSSTQPFHEKYGHLKDKNLDVFNKCFDGKKITLVYLKPKHIEMTPSDFWIYVENAHQVGLVVLARRHNVLALEVSSYELNKNPNVFRLYSDAISQIRRRAIEAAKKHLTIIEFEFGTLVTRAWSARPWHQAGPKAAVSSGSWAFEVSWWGSAVFCWRGGDRGKLCWARAVEFFGFASGLRKFHVGVAFSGSPVGLSQFFVWAVLGKMLC
jgi:hypothetical protein